MSLSKFNLTFSKFKSFIIDKKSRILKVSQFGAKTARESMPFGDDSSPLKDMTAIFGTTSENGDNVVIGYINNNQKSLEGEKRIYSLNPIDSSLSFDIILRTDGTCEIGGSSDNAVRFSELEKSYNELRDDLNALISKYNSHVHTANGVVTTSLANQSSATITAAKIDEIKVV